MKKLEIYPSLLAANNAVLGDECMDAVNSGADGLHLDVMDGVYVNNYTHGLNVISDLRAFGITAPFDVHLMVDNPFAMIEDVAKVGGNSVTCHSDTHCKLENMIKEAQFNNLDFGLAINPDDDLSALKANIEKIDLVLIMAVHPGFGGQKFIELTLQRILKVSDMLREAGREIPISVDGGVNSKNASNIVTAGATRLIAGSYVFKHKSYQKAIQSLRD